MSEEKIDNHKALLSSVAVLRDQLIGSSINSETILKGLRDINNLELKLTASLKNTELVMKEAAESRSRL